MTGSEQDTFIGGTALSRIELPGPSAGVGCAVRNQSALSKKERRCSTQRQARRAGQPESLRGLGVCSASCRGQVMHRFAPRYGSHLFMQLGLQSRGSGAFVGSFADFTCLDQWRFFAGGRRGDRLALKAACRVALELKKQRMCGEEELRHACRRNSWRARPPAAGAPFFTPLHT